MEVKFKALRELSELLRGQNICHFGIAEAKPAPAAEREYQSWIENGYHGSMSYLARHADRKYRPDVLLPGCRSIIMVCINYYQEDAESRFADLGTISRYAWGRDYHKVLGGRLRRICGVLRDMYPNDRFAPFSDATPLDERYYAGAAGLGFPGRNSLLITREFGSWVFLGGILSTYPFEPSANQLPVCECPSSCNLCIKACPTGAIFAPHKIEASKCISYLTIENKDMVPAEYRKSIDGRLFGCDRCQSVCPFNKKAKQTDEQDFHNHIAGPALDLLSVLKIKNDGEFVRKFAGSPLMRAKRNLLVRNACIAASNRKLYSAYSTLKQLSEDGNAIVAAHARRAAEELASKS
jgi:epoxyqueuosine reductase